MTADQVAFALAQWAAELDNESAVHCAMPPAYKVANAGLSTESLRVSWHEIAAKLEGKDLLSPMFYDPSEQAVFPVEIPGEAATPMSEPIQNATPIPTLAEGSTVPELEVRIFDLDVSFVDEFDKVSHVNLQTEHSLDNSHSSEGYSQVKPTERAAQNGSAFTCLLTHGLCGTAQVQGKYWTCCGPVNGKMWNACTFTLIVVCVVLSFATGNSTMASIFWIFSLIAACCGCCLPCCGSPPDEEQKPTLEGVYTKQEYRRVSVKSHASAVAKKNLQLHKARKNSVCCEICLVITSVVIMWIIDFVMGAMSMFLLGENKCDINTAGSPFYNNYPSALGCNKTLHVASLGGCADGEVELMNRYTADINHINSWFALIYPIVPLTTCCPFTDGVDCGNYCCRSGKTCVFDYGVHNQCGFYEGLGPASDDDGSRRLSYGNVSAVDDADATILMCYDPIDSSLTQSGTFLQQCRHRGSHLTEPQLDVQHASFLAIPGSALD